MSEVLYLIAKGDSKLPKVLLVGTYLPGQIATGKWVLRRYW